MDADVLHGDYVSLNCNHCKRAGKQYGFTCNQCQSFYCYYCSLGPEKDVRRGPTPAIREYCLANVRDDGDYVCETCQVALAPPPTPGIEPAPVKGLLVQLFEKGILTEETMRACKVGKAAYNPAYAAHLALVASRSLNPQGSNATDTTDTTETQRTGNEDQQNSRARDTQPRQEERNESFHEFLEASDLPLGTGDPTFTGHIGPNTDDVSLQGRQQGLGGETPAGRMSHGEFGNEGIEQPRTHPRAVSEEDRDRPTVESGRPAEEVNALKDEVQRLTQLLREAGIDRRGPSGLGPPANGAPAMRLSPHPTSSTPRLPEGRVTMTGGTGPPHYGMGSQPDGRPPDGYAHMMDRLLQQNQSLQDALTTFVSSQRTPSTAPQDRPPQLKVQMPKVEIPTFDGKEVLEFPDWLERFSLWMESGNYDDRYKMSCLLSSLKGSALQKVQGLGASGHAYLQAMAILKDNYGDTAAAISAATHRIQKAKSVTSDLHNLEPFIDIIRNNYSFLRRYGVPEPRLEALVPILLSKLPELIKLEVFKALNKTDIGTISINDIITCLTHQLKLRKAMKLVHGESHTPSNPDTRNNNNPHRGRDSRKGSDRKFHREESSDRMPPTMMALTPTQSPAPSGRRGNTRQSQRNTDARNRSPSPWGTNQSTRWNSKEDKDKSVHFCPFCEKGKHDPTECRTYVQPQARRDRLFELQRCYRCLSKAHLAKNCDRRVSCRDCGASGHHTAICDPTWAKGKRKHSGNTQLIQDNTRSTVEDKPTAVGLLHKAPLHHDSEVVMANFHATATNPADPEAGRPVFVYCDGGATKTCIRAQVARQLQLPILGELTMETATFGDKTPKDVLYQAVRFDVVAPNGFKIPLRAWAVEEICPPVSIQTCDWTPKRAKEIRERFPNLLNPPPKKTLRKVVDVLLGMDVLNILTHCPSNKVTHLEGTLLINETPMGPLLYGGQPVKFSQKEKKQFHQLVNNSTHKDIADLYTLENLGIQREELTTTETDEARRIFQENLSRRPDGSYEVGLPLKEELDDLPDGKGIAWVRLRNLYQSLLRKDKVYIRQYHNQLMELVDERLFEVIDNDEPAAGPVHYLSHFPVFKEDSLSTKMRIVIDPSQKLANGRCLNSYMYTGPNLLKDLLGIVIRARLPRVLVVCDIRKAFLMIHLSRAHQDLTRLLWVRDPNKPPCRENTLTLRILRVPFGYAAAPFLLNATLEHHFNSYDSSTVRTMANNCYVDNICLHAKDKEEAWEMYKESKQVLADCKMDLRQYLSNSREFNERVPTVDRSTEPTDKTKFLGLSWDIRLDGFGLYDIDQTEPTTKRSMLSAYSCIWDPLQLFAPIVIRAKLFYQSLCEKGYSWDERLPDDVIERWTPVQDDLHQLCNLMFPRHVLPAGMEVGARLVVFTDASNDAHAATVYMVQEGRIDHNSPVSKVLAKTWFSHPDDRPHQFSSQLLVAKASPNPKDIKKKDMPKLEILALWKGVRLLEYVKRQLPPELKILESRIYTDSEIAVHQCFSTRSHTIFVRNRVRDIRAAMDSLPFTLHHVAGKENPADLATRGYTYDEFIKRPAFQLWMFGPRWLHSHPRHWPRWREDPSGMQVDKNTELESEEEDLDPQVILAIQDVRQGKSKKNETPGPFGLLASEYTTANRLWHVTAYSQRFLDKAQKKRVHASVIILGREIKQCRLMWIKSVQDSCLEDIRKLILQDKKHKLPKELRKMDLSIDPQGIIRGGSRLHLAPIPYESKFPAILPRDHPFTELMIMESHVECGHLRARITLTNFRRRYWITGGFAKVYAVIINCVDCRRFDGQAFNAPTYAPIPTDRYTMGLPFAYMGIDIAGPINLRIPIAVQLAQQEATKTKMKSKDTFAKGWILVTTCLVTRAVDLELLPDYTGKSVILALRRVFSRRGIPNTIWSDNASNLLYALEHLNLAASEPVLSKEERVEVVTFLSDKGITLKQIPVAHPASGGAWERMVKIVKTTLMKILYNRTIPADEFRTLLSEVTTMVNSRPLFWVGEDIADGLLITPNHFLGLTSRLALPESLADLDSPPDDPPYEEKDLPALYPKLIKALDQIWDHFQTAIWQRLSEEHRNRFKPTPGAVDRPPQIGELCLIKEDAPRLTWRLCQITAEIPGKDDKIRTVQVRTSNGRYSRRHVRDLVPLLYEPRIKKKDAIPTTSQAREHNYVAHDSDPNLQMEEPESDEEVINPVAPRPQFAPDRGRSVRQALLHNVTPPTQDPPFPLEAMPVWGDTQKLKVTVAYELHDQYVEEQRDQGSFQQDPEERPEQEMHHDAMEAGFFNVQDQDVSNQLQGWVQSETANPGGKLIRRRNSASSDSGWSPNWSLLALSIVMLLSLFTPVQGNSIGPSSLPAPPHHRYQLCVHTPRGGKALFLPARQEPCSLPRPRHQREDVQLTLWVPTGELPTTRAIKCYTETARVITYTSVLLGKGIVEDTRGQLTHQGVHPEDCRQAWETRTHNNITLQEVTTGVWTTNQELQIHYKWCCYGVVNEITNIIIIEGSVAAAQDEELVSDLGSLGGCRLRDLQCAQKEYTIMWDETQLKAYCPYKRKGSYEATVNKDLLVIDTLQAALTIKPTPSGFPFISSECLPPGTFVTKEGPAVYFKYNPDSRQTHSPSFGEDEDANRYDINSTSPRQGETVTTIQRKLTEAQELFGASDPLNSKLHFLGEVLEDAIEQRFSLLFHHFCVLASHQLATAVQLVHLDPTRGIRALLGRDDVAATLHGDLAYIHACHPVEVEQLFLDHRVPGQDRCTEFIPARLGDGQLLYVAPGSHDLVPSSPSIPCHQVRPAALPSPVDVKSGTVAWHTVAGRVHVSELSHQSELNLTQLTFGAPPLFDARVIYPSSALAAYTERIRHMENTIHAVINYTAELSLHPPSVRAVLIASGEVMEKAVGTVGRGLSGFISGIGQGLGHLASNVLSPLWTLLSNGLVIVLIVGAIGFALYWTCRSGLVRRCLRRGRRTRRRGERDQRHPSPRHQDRGDKALLSAIQRHLRIPTASPPPREMVHYTPASVNIEEREEEDDWITVVRKAPTTDV